MKHFLWEAFGLFIGYLESIYFMEPSLGQVISTHMGSGKFCIKGVLINLQYM